MRVFLIYKGRDSYRYVSDLGSLAPWSSAGLGHDGPRPAMHNPGPMDEAHITAIHEAAHAVAAIRTGLIFDHVTAQPDYELELEGQLQWGELHASGDIEVPPELLAIVLLAGPCAEARITRRELDEVFADEEALDDRESLAGLMLDQARFLQASRDTLELLEADWPLIERVADELLEADSLGYERVSALVAAHDG